MRSFLLCSQLQTSYACNMSNQTFCQQNYYFVKKNRSFTDLKQVIVRYSLLLSPNSVQHGGIDRGEFTRDELFLCACQLDKFSRHRKRQIRYIFLFVSFTLDLPIRSLLQSQTPICHSLMCMFFLLLKNAMSDVFFSLSFSLIASSRKKTQKRHLSIHFITTTQLIQGASCTKVGLILCFFSYAYKKNILVSNSLLR